MITSFIKMTYYSLWEENYITCHIANFIYHKFTHDKISQQFLTRKTNENPYLRYLRHFLCSDPVWIYSYYSALLFYFADTVALPSVHASIFLPLLWSFTLSLMNLLKCESNTICRTIFLAGHVDPGVRELYIMFFLPCGCIGSLKCFGPHGAGRVFCSDFWHIGTIFCITVRMHHSNPIQLHSL